MKLQVSDAAIKLLGSLGYDPSYGARPVKRVIQQNVENELAKGILRGQFKDEDTVLIDTEVTAFSNGQLPQQKLVFKDLILIQIQQRKQKFFRRLFEVRCTCNNVNLVLLPN